MNSLYLSSCNKLNNVAVTFKIKQEHKIFRDGRRRITLVTKQLKTHTFLRIMNVCKESLPSARSLKKYFFQILIVRKILKKVLFLESLPFARSLFQDLDHPQDLTNSTFLGSLPSASS